MHVICTAMVDDDRSRQNLCECVKILGQRPQVSGKTVCVDYDGLNRTADKLVDVFSQFPCHEITVIS